MFCSQCGANNNQESKFCAACGAQLVLATEPAIQQLRHTSLPPSPKYAGFWLRILAALIDGVIVQFVIIVIIFPYYASVTTPEDRSLCMVMSILIGTLVQWLWFTIAESSKWQATVGKKILGLKVTDESGERIRVGKANGRYWSKILSGLILFIGFVMVAFTKKKQGLHDKIAGTLVVKANG